MTELQKRVQNDWWVKRMKLMLSKGMITLLEATDSVSHRWRNGHMTIAEAEEAVRQLARIRIKNN